MSRNLAIIGAGVSGLSCANFLKDRYNVTVFEKEHTPGGLIRCKRVNGSLFHLCGGHVFNTKLSDVNDYFWSVFSKNDFIKTERNSAVVFPDGTFIPYPIESNIYHLSENIQKEIIAEWLTLGDAKYDVDYLSFGDFLRSRFGLSLYNLYFGPYNNKVWGKSPDTVPLSLMEGKLPMPSVNEMIFDNINHSTEKDFVHSSFWYEKNNGSQFIADTLAAKINVRYDCRINSIVYQNQQWLIDDMPFDVVVYCGNIQELVSILSGVDISSFIPYIASLAYHGTTTAFCEIDKNPYSWVYQPSTQHRSHRIICTGNFSFTNNAPGKMTATIEFSGH